MPHPRFKTSGKLPHQVSTIAWAARRCEGNDAWFDPGEDHGAIQQRGVLIADGVGMGKTREALASAALILLKRYTRTSSGKRRQRHKQTSSAVLVLCPPGLVSKWADEILSPEKFRHDLHRWAGKDQRRQFVQRTLEHARCIRHRRDLPENVPDGTYLCNWNVVRGRIGSGNSKLSRFMKKDWKVVIVDEAHHGEARLAIERLDHRNRIDRLILLTATPFQLDPKELRQPLRFLTNPQSGGHGWDLMKRNGSVMKFSEQMGAFFAGGKEPEQKDEKRAAQAQLRQLVARNRPITKGRDYQLILADGKALRIVNPATVSEQQLIEALGKAPQLNPAWQQHYLQQRIALADRATVTRTHVPRALLSLLTKPISGSNAANHPRIALLNRWAHQQFAQNLIQMAQDGIPRKTLIFTTLVNGVHDVLVTQMQRSLQLAWKEPRVQRRWRGAIRHAGLGANKLKGFAVTLCQKLNEGRDRRSLKSVNDIVLRLSEKLDRIKQDAHESPFLAALGIPRYRELLRSFIEPLLVALVEPNDDGDTDVNEHRWRQQRTRDARRKLDAIISGLDSDWLCGRYAGDVIRHERDQYGYAFCSPVGPWVLIASRAGSEGIDLHTFSTNLVHYDLEWNPAVMEQREGRCDRIGRHAALKKQRLVVSYLVLKGTYDERMFHQVVMRQRWQPLLLGGHAKRLGSAEDNQEVIARSLGSQEASEWQLDLAPRFSVS